MARIEPTTAVFCGMEGAALVEHADDLVGQ